MKLRKGLMGKGLLVEEELAGVGGKWEREEGESNQNTLYTGVKLSKKKLKV